MNIINYLAQWLADFEFAALLLLTLGWLTLHWLRQPVHRVAWGWNIALALIVLLALTAVPMWPRWHAPSAVAMESPAVTSKSLPTVSKSAEFLSLSAPNFGPGQVSTVQAGSRSASSRIVGWIYCLFLLGAAISLGWLILGWVQAARICRRGKPAPAHLQNQLDSLIKGQIARPRLLLSDDVPNAVSLGIFRPTILLPADMAELAPAASLRAILAHELAHIRNRDLWLVGMLRALLPLLYPQPFFWLVRRAIRSSQETVADAMAADGRGCDYADGLINWLRQLPSRKKIFAMPAVGIWERPSELSRRIVQLLNDGSAVQTRVGRRWRVGAATVIVTLTLGLSALSIRPVAARDEGLASQSVNRPATTLVAAEIHGASDRQRFFNIFSNLTAHSAQVDAKSRHFVYSGNVVVTNAQGRFSCEQLTFNLPSTNSSNKAISAIAETNFVFVFRDAKNGKTNRLTAGKGVYDYHIDNGVTNEIWTFTESPSLATPKSHLSATKIMWNLATGTLSVEGAQMIVNGNDTSPGPR